MNTTLQAGTKKRSRRWAGVRRVALYFFAALFVAWLVYSLYPKPILVESAKVEEGPLTVTVLEEGKTRVRDRYVVTAPVSGLMRRVELKAGAPVKAAETVLATIQAEASSFLDPRSRTQAEARVQAADATLSQRQSALERARAELDLAQKEVRRGEELRSKGAMAEREWDSMESAAEVRVRDVRTAEFAFKVAQFELDQAKAALIQGSSEAGENLLQIRSPVSGYLLTVFEESARVIAAGTPILEVGDVTALEIEAEILSQDAASIHPGAQMFIEQWGGEPLKARVRTVEPAAFTKISALGVEEQRVKVIADFVEPIPADRFLGDRYRVETRVVTWASDKVVKIPAGALFRRGGEWMTFLIQDGKAKLIRVDVGHHNGVEAEVLSGVKPGGRVILHPPDRLEEGNSVVAR